MEVKYLLKQVMLIEKYYTKVLQFCLPRTSGYKYTIEILKRSTPHNVIIIWCRVFLFWIMFWNTPGDAALVTYFTHNL